MSYITVLINDFHIKLYGALYFFFLDCFSQFVKLHVRRILSIQIGVFVWEITPQKHGEPFELGFRTIWSRSCEKSGDATI